MTWAVRPPPLPLSSLLRGRLRPAGDSHQLTFLVTRLLCGGVVFALRHPPSTDKTRFFVYSPRNRHQHPNYPAGRDGGGAVYWPAGVGEPSLLYGEDCLDISFLQLTGSLDDQARSESPERSLESGENLTE